MYAVSEISIPLDEVDSEITKKPEHWNMRFIRNFMLVLGPVSSVFDFLTFDRRGAAGKRTTRPR